MGGYGLTYTDISDNILYSGKSYSISNGDLFDICNDTVTTVLETILDYLNDFEQVSTESCKVKVSTRDEVCGYLSEKIVSIDNTVNISTYCSGTGTALDPIDCKVNLSVSPNIDIINDTTSLTTDIVVSTTTDIYSVPFPISTSNSTGGLFNDGDTLEVDFLIEVSTAGLGATFETKFNSVLIESAQTFAFSNFKAFRYKFTVTRINNLNVRIRGSKQGFTYSNPNYIGSTELLINTNVAVSDLDSSINLFKVTASVLPSGTLTGKNLLITKLKK